MNSQAHMWGDLRSAIHNGQSALDLSTRLDRFTGSDREHALRYLLEQVGGSEAFWHGMSQGYHTRLSWLLPMMTAEHIQLIDSALHGIHFELEREVGFKLQQLEVDVDWLLQWQLQLLDKVYPRAFSKKAHPIDIINELKDLSDFIHKMPRSSEDAKRIETYWEDCEQYVYELDRTLYARREEFLIQEQFDDEEPDEDGLIWPYWVAETTLESDARLLLEESMRHTMTAMQHISGIDNQDHDYNTYETTRRVGASLGYALEYVHLSSQPRTCRDRRIAQHKAQQEILSDFARFMLNKYASLYELRL